MAMTKDKKIAAWVLAVVLIPLLVLVVVAGISTRHTASVQENNQAAYEFISGAGGLDSTQAEGFAKAVCANDYKTASLFLFDAGVEHMPESDLKTLVKWAIESHCPNG